MRPGRRVTMVCVLLLAACDPGQGTCSENARDVGYAEVTDGVSAKQLMDGVAGTVHGKLQWHGGGDQVTVHPASGSTELELTLAYDGGQVRLIERDEQNLGPNERLACFDDLVIPATLTLSTADGALEGSWGVEVKHMLGAGSSLGVEIQPFEPGDGEFSAALTHPEQWDAGTEQLRFDGSFHEGAITGELVMSASRALPAEGNLVEGADLTVTLASWTLTP